MNVCVLALVNWARYAADLITNDPLEAGSQLDRTFSYHRFVAGSRFTAEHRHTSLGELYRGCSTLFVAPAGEVHGTYDNGCQGTDS